MPRFTQDYTSQLPQPRCGCAGTQSRRLRMVRAAAPGLRPIYWRLTGTGKYGRHRKFCTGAALEPCVGTRASSAVGIPAPSRRKCILLFVRLRLGAGPGSKDKTRAFAPAAACRRTDRSAWSALWIPPWGARCVEVQTRAQVAPACVSGKCDLLASGLDKLPRAYLA